MRDYAGEICRCLDDGWSAAREDRSFFFQRLRSSKHVCLFGAGQVGRAVAHDLVAANVKIAGFCDNNRELWGTIITNTAICLSPQELEKIKSDACVLVTTGYYKEICSQLESLGIKNYCVVPQLMVRNSLFWDTVDLSFVKSKVIGLIDILEDEKSKEVACVIAKNWFNRSDSGGDYRGIETCDQYFPGDIIRLEEDEVFVDVGAYDGDTMAEFLRRAGARFQAIIAYELDRCCFDRLQDYVRSVPANLRSKIHIYNLGLHSQSQKIRYMANGTSSSIHDQADQHGEVVRMTDHLRNAKITYIKMDIEGAELDALQGAKESILAYAPKLAISVYHAPDHLWEIPMLLKSFVPRYRLYLRHHTSLAYETVCYAVLK
jgi:FkbM family methyltransferase